MSSTRLSALTALSALMRRTSLPLIGILASAATFGCAPDDTADPYLEGEGRVAITVAPLNLEAIGFACYDLELYAIDTTDPNAIPELVWSRGDPNTDRADENGDSGDVDTLCSNLYGNGPGGDIFYVGTCDASNPTHVLTVVVDGLYRPLGGRLPEPDDWVNPCPPSSPCEFYATCIENADTPVVVNLTILRSANQGFFDIAVRFDEIFCSAKVDCTYDLVAANGDTDREPILGLHNANGDPDYTAVIGFACTAGPGEQEATELFVNPPRIECSGEPLFGSLSSFAMCVESPAGSEMFTSFGFTQTTGLNTGLTPRALFSQQANFVYERYETSVWSLDGVTANTWTQDEFLPLVERTTGVVYDSFQPIQQVAQDVVLGYVGQSGVSPISSRIYNPFPQFDTVRLAAVRFADGAWSQLHVLPTLEEVAFAYDFRYDPITRVIVLTTEHPDAMDPGQVRRSLRFYAFDGNDRSGFNEIRVEEAPAGAQFEIVTALDGTFVTSLQPDWGASIFWTGSSEHTMHTIDGSGIYRRAPMILSNFDLGQAGFVDGAQPQGLTWDLVDVSPSSLYSGSEVYVISANEVLMSGLFQANTDEQRRLPIQVTLREPADVQPGDPAFGVKLVPLHVTHASLTPYWSVWTDQLGSLGRGFTYDSTIGGFLQPKFIAYAGGGHSLYADWKTWRVDSPSGNSVYIDRVVESGLNRYHLLIARGNTNEVVQTDQVCDLMFGPWGQCNSPPPGTNWQQGTCIDIGGGNGQCQYQRNVEVTHIGYLDPTEPNVTWFDTIPSPTDVSGIELRNIHDVKDGVSLVFRTWGDRNGVVVVDILQPLPNEEPALGDYRVLLGSTPEQSVEYDRFIKGLENQDEATRYDFRTRDTRKACRSVHDGLGSLSSRLIAMPLSDMRSPISKVGNSWQLLGWNTESAGTPYPALSDANAWSGFQFNPSAGFQSDMDQRIARAESARYLYAVLPLDHPEGQGQFFSYLDDSNEPGNPENPPPEDFPLYQYATYHNEEELDCGGEPCNKMFFNMALGIRPEYANCMLAFEGTAAKPGLLNADNGWSLSDMAYPVIVARVNLTPEDSEFGVCGANPLNGENSGVATVYVRPGGVKETLSNAAEAGSFELERTAVSQTSFPFAYRLHVDEGGKTVLQDLYGLWPYGFDWLNPQPTEDYANGFDGIKKELVAKQWAPLDVRTASLETEDDTAISRSIAQFPETWPDCDAGHVYVPDMFRCVAVCGDGAVHGDEACDDGNTNDGDGCSSNCRNEFTCTGTDKRIPVDYLCDGYADCPGPRPADERGTLCFTCGDTFDRIFTNQVCDGVVDCDSGRDEAICGPDED